LARHAAPETVERFIQLLANCEMARYSQHHTDASVESDFGNAVQVITELDKQVKK
jgi:aerotolerance-related protein batD